MVKLRFREIHKAISQSNGHLAPRQPVCLFGRSGSCKLANSLEEHGGDVSLTGIRQDRNDGLPGKLELLRQPHGHSSRGAAGNTTQDTLLPRQPPTKFNRLFIRDLLDTINKREIENLGDKARSDSLDLVWTGLQRLTSSQLSQDRARRRLDRHRQDFLALGYLDKAGKRR